MIFFVSTLALFFAVACEKEITVDLPHVEQKIVIEGTIYNDQPPIVMLSWSQGYFETTDIESILNMYIHGATVRLSDGNTEYPLQEFCASSLTEAELTFASDILGIPVDEIQAMDLCIYTNLSLLGQPGKTYTLTVDYDGHHLSSVTSIPELVYLSDTKFQIVSTLPNDSLGFLFAKLEDPDTLGNAYRWSAKRINHYPQWIPDEELRGRQKDLNFVAPLGSVIDDSFFNGLSFEFMYYRGTTPNTSQYDDLNHERGYYKRGDTVVVRGCSIDRGAYKFLYSLESMVGNQGSPFSLPANLESNVHGGGLGAFVGYGAIYDTIVCQ